MTHDEISSQNISFPCPFCPGVSHWVHTIGLDIFGKCYVKCGRCGAQGPVGKTREEAIHLWNSSSKSLPLDQLTFVEDQYNKIKRKAKEMKQLPLFGGEQS